MRKELFKGGDCRLALGDGSGAGFGLPVNFDLPSDDPGGCSFSLLKTINNSSDDEFIASLQTFHPIFLFTQAKIQRRFFLSDTALPFIHFQRSSKVS